MLLSSTGVFDLLASYLRAFVLIAVASSPSAAQLSGASAALYAQAIKDGKFTSNYRALKTDVSPTTDNKSFYVVWKTAEHPKRWMVTVHGTGGFATDQLAVWSAHLKDREIGVISMQWWFGRSGPGDYYPPADLYREIAAALAAQNVTPGYAMLFGFSRGSANSFAVKAIDAGRGKNYFALNVASSGGVALNFPPTAAIAKGDYGKDPLRGTKWVTSAGAKDPNPDRDGINGMRDTKKWLESQGATVVKAIEDPKFGHGALVLNAGDARQVIDLFFKLTP